ncbi:hypothetical protein RYX36_004448 [Vicia faba]
MIDDANLRNKRQVKIWIRDVLLYNVIIAWFSFLPGHTIQHRSNETSKDGAVAQIISDASSPAISYVWTAARVLTRFSPLELFLEPCVSDDRVSNVFSEAFETNSHCRLSPIGFPACKQRAALFAATFGITVKILVWHISIQLLQQSKAIWDRLTDSFDDVLDFQSLLLFLTAFLWFFCKTCYYPSGNIWTDI